MALDCGEIVLPEKTTSVIPIKCNPQEDSSLENKVTADLPPWSQLEQIKKEANEVEMLQQRSVQMEDPKAIITVISGSEVVMEEIHDPKKEILFSEESSIVEDECPPPKSTSRSEYTSFTKAPSRYVYKIQPENQEHTVENFNQFLEISSMTTSSLDHAKVMGTVPKHKTDLKNLWPSADAPSGILLVFDRMLDCIDPKEARCLDEGYETDHSSTRSFSFLEQFEDLSLSGSIATDESSLFRFRTSQNFKLGTDWLDESLDCVFPCWKEQVPVVNELAPPPKRPTPKELAQALEACRKRKWQKEQEHVVSDEIHVEVNDEIENDNDDDDADPFDYDEADEIGDDNDDFDPFDFPMEEFPPPVWKDADNASGSSLSELFEGLVYGTPSDEKDERELHGFLDRTSFTEETSTLSYSDGTL